MSYEALTFLDNKLYIDGTNAVNAKANKLNIGWNFPMVAESEATMMLEAVRCSIAIKVAGVNKNVDAQYFRLIPQKKVIDKLAKEAEKKAKKDGHTHDPAKFEVVLTRPPLPRVRA